MKNSNLVVAAFPMGLAVLTLLGAGCAEPHSQTSASRPAVTMPEAGLKSSGNMKDAEEEKETPFPVADLPKPVVDGVMKAMPESKITDAEKELHDGKTIYELDLKFQNKKFEVKVDEQGTIVSKEEENEDEHEHAGEVGKK